MWRHSNRVEQLGDPVLCQQREDRLQQLQMQAAGLMSQTLGLFYLLGIILFLFSHLYFVKLPILVRKSFGKTWIALLASDTNRH